MAIVRGKVRTTVIDEANALPRRSLQGVERPQIHMQNLKLRGAGQAWACEGVAAARQALREVVIHLERLRLAATHCQRISMSQLEVGVAAGPFVDAYQARCAFWLCTSLHSSRQWAACEDEALACAVVSWCHLPGLAHKSAANVAVCILYGQQAGRSMSSCSHE